MYNKAYGLFFAFEVNIMKITDSEGLGNIIRNRRKELKYTAGIFVRIYWS